MPSSLFRACSYADRACGRRQRGHRASVRVVVVGLPFEAEGRLELERPVGVRRDAEEVRAWCRSIPSRTEAVVAVAPRRSRVVTDVRRRSTTDVAEDVRRTTSSVLPSVQLATTSTWSPAWSVPASSWFGVAGDLDGAHRPLHLRADPAARRRCRSGGASPARRRRSGASTTRSGDLVGARDRTRARRPALEHDRLVSSACRVDEIGAGRAGRDVASRRRRPARSSRPSAPERL